MTDSQGAAWIVVIFLSVAASLAWVTAQWVHP
jgi:hypothetical protein